MIPFSPRFRLRTLLVAAAALSLLIFGILWPEISRRRFVTKRHAYIEKRMTSAFSEEGRWILDRPTNVEAYRVREAEPGVVPAGTSVEEWASWRLVATGTKARGGREQASQIARLFLEGERYLALIGGDYPPDTILRFGRDDKTLVIVLACHGPINQLAVDLVSPQGELKHVSFATDCYDKPGPSSPSISMAVSRFLKDWGPGIVSVARIRWHLSLTTPPGRTVWPALENPRAQVCAPSRLPLARRLE